MAVTLVEKPERQGDTSPAAGSGRWVYVARVTGEANPETALISAVISDTGFFWYNLAVRKVSFEELGGDLYSVTVDWEYEVPDGAAQDPTASPGPTDGPGGTAPSGTPSGPSSADSPIGPNVSLEIGGRPPKLRTSRAVTYSEIAGGLGDPPDNGLLLNVDRKTGEVNGLEVDDPAVVLTIDITFDYVTMGYVERLRGAVWHVNSADWYHLPAGSVAFMGCTLQTQDSGRARGAFRFGLGPGKDLTEGELRGDVGNELPTGDVLVRGWDYVEIGYAESYDSAAGLVVSKPKWVRVHEIFPTFDFASFGIGGA